MQEVANKGRRDAATFLEKVVSAMVNDNVGSGDAEVYVASYVGAILAGFSTSFLAEDDPQQVALWNTLCGSFIKDYSEEFMKSHGTPIEMTVASPIFSLKRI